jgi:hypothetical protein
MGLLSGEAPKLAVPAAMKTELELKAQQLIAQHLKPNIIKPPPEDPQFNYLFNYLTDIWTKWYRSYFYFCGTFASPGPYALSPTFEDRFVCMGDVGNDNFSLAYMRYTGQWIELYPELSIDACLDLVRDDPLFFPPF